MSTPLGLGVRVVRGPDWKWGDQDGGEGCTGTVVEISGPGRASKSPDETVIVQWDCGSRTNYRIGHLKAYDLRVIDNATIGIRHNNVTCKSCTKDDVITGIRWNCASCPEVNLCTTCYMADKHDTSHSFWRLDKMSTSGVLVGPRKGCRKVTLKGIYPGAKVKRGYDWAWNDQDGGEGKVGKVLDVQGWDHESARSVVSVVWNNSSVTNIYRVGHRGKVDLECVSVASSGGYYPDHLPITGCPASVEVMLEEPVSSEVPFRVGDRVEVCVAPQVLRNLQVNHGGFNPRMNEIIDKRGVVHRITNNGDVRVQYPGTPESSYRWTINPKALKKVSAFKPGDIVRIVDNSEALAKLHHDQRELVREAVGKTGRVVKVYTDGELKVSVSGTSCTLSPLCLSILVGPETQANNTDRKAGINSNVTRQLDQLAHDVVKVRLDPLAVEDESGNSEAVLKLKTSSERTSAALAAARHGHLSVLQTIFQQAESNFVDENDSAKTLLHVAISGRHDEIVDFLLASNFVKSHVNAKDSEGDTPLHCAAFTKQITMMEKLITSGADVNALNAKHRSALLISTHLKDVDAVTLLLRHPEVDVNLCDRHGNTPLHEAIVKDDHVILALLCSAPTTDFGVTNVRGFNCFHYAAMKGNCVALQLMIAQAPALVHKRKEDGYTPLMLSSLNGHMDCVVALLDHGALLDEVDLKGQSALHVAAQQGHAAVIELLLSRVSDKKLINMQDGDGETPLHMALSREGEPPIPLSPETSPSIYKISKKASAFGVPMKAIHATSIAAFMVSKGGKVNLKNSRAHKPLDQVFDQTAKSFLLDVSSNHKVSPPDQPTVPGGPSTDECVTECRICCELLPKVTFEPCGHTVACSDCSKRMKKCLECQIVIERKVFPEAAGFVDDREAKYRDLEDKFLCSICMERTKKIVFLCGHGACLQCAETLNTCHMCRSPITKKIVIY